MAETTKREDEGAAMDLSEYTFETLRRDEEFIVYRGRCGRETDASPPSIIAMAPVSERPAVTSLRRMEQENSFKAELNSDRAVRPLALASHGGRAMLVLTDPGGEPLERLLGRPMQLTEFLRTAIGLSTALSKMHGRGIVHKDVKPANILVKRGSGEAWLTGFGIASQLPRERQVPVPPESIAGTLAYMAPEQTGRMNRSIDCRSDLYSLGVTLYQMLTGSLPFTTSDPMELVHCHIARKPAPPSERLEKIPAPLSHIIMKLLAKTAEERHGCRLLRWKRRSSSCVISKNQDRPGEVTTTSSELGYQRSVKCARKMLHFILKPSPNAGQQTITSSSPMSKDCNLATSSSAAKSATENSWLGEPLAARLTAESSWSSCDLLKGAQSDCDKANDLNLSLMIDINLVDLLPRSVARVF